ncbi:FecR family protein [Algoriphagus kandeliae]|uniref:FecR family protein n=1 Tax=Algoriphagus kandeliae TaxID=2562278 RepID=A0A4Y9R252_9BACT|nr:FecR family protein [Algoriphagus kandeliae]TFV97693.1 FecR family protein [Algoriphagus kandeliae]
MSDNKTYLNYKDYQLEDFLADEFFIEWVKTPNENNKHFWEKWLSEHPEKRQIVLKASQIIRSIQYSKRVDLSDSNYVRIFENVIRQTPSAEASFGSKTSRMRKWLFSFRQIAAVLIIGVSLWYFWSLGQKERVLPVEEITTSEIVQRTTPKGQKATFILEDGTKIFLNSNSQIRFPKKFEKESRQVTLKGEAFFEVAEEERPFIVQTADIEVEVLGTSFNVKESEEGLLSVALVTGKVRIDDQKGNRLMLAPNEMMVFDQFGEFRKTGFDPLEMTGWKDKKLVFNKNDILEVKYRLENWYGVEITIKGKFPNNWSYSGIYQDETLENVLLGLSRATDLTFSLKDKKVEIAYQ